MAYFQVRTVSFRECKCGSRISHVGPLKINMGTLNLNIVLQTPVLNGFLGGKETDPAARCSEKAHEGS